MRGSVFNVRAGWPAGRGKAFLLGWLVAEILALTLVVKVLGFGGAVLLTIGSSVLGVVMLRRLGLNASEHLRGAMTGGVARDGVVLDGTVAAFGALLLILPGFVTDIAGLALASPSIRQALLARFGGAVVGPVPPARRPANPDVIDLSPSDWTVVENPRQR